MGSGTLITFPVLLALGYAPVTANVSNTIGLVPGSASGAYGYRHELAGQRGRTLRLATASLAGGVIGAVLLLTLPASAFKAIVPAFIAVALALVVLQPWLAGLLEARRRAADRAEGQPDGGAPAMLGTLASGIYGGYFGAAQGIMLLAVLGVVLDEPLQRVNAVKVVLAGLVNLVSGLIFAVVAHVAWDAAGLIAVGSSLGGLLGARFGRRFAPGALRALIVLVGVTAIVRLVA
jgi:uncharacterized protein